ARMRVALRHAQAGASPSPLLEFGELAIDRGRGEGSRAGEPLHLTPIEYKLLVLLAQNAGKVLTHRQILNDVWGPAYAAQTHYVRVRMAELRKKLESGASPARLLVTEPGVGYRLRGEPATP